MKTEKKLIKQYLELKYKYNRTICKINALADKSTNTYQDDVTYEHLKMVLNQIELALKSKSKELSKVLEWVNVLNVSENSINRHTPRILTILHIQMVSLGNY